MNDSSTKKSVSLETLVIQHISNINDLKAKLNDIINNGKDYQYDVSSCLKSLLKSDDQEIVLSTIKAISELVKCDTKRNTYAVNEIIEPILSILDKNIFSENVEMTKQCCRALGNLCCDCDPARNIILGLNGVPVLISLLKESIGDNIANLNEIKIIISKTILNFSLGGGKYSNEILNNGVVDVLKKILLSEAFKEDVDDDLLSTALLILNVINDNSPDHLYSEEINIAVLNVLKETTNLEVSELCLDHLHSQAEHDSVKILLAKDGNIHFICRRLEHLIQMHDSEELNMDETEVNAVVKQACELLIIVLTGDDAMDLLYNKGIGEIYLTMVKWLDSSKHQLLSTAILAIGNFARKDDYCIQMMEDKIFDKLLDIFEIYHGFSKRMKKEPEAIHPIDEPTITQIEHATLSALRNLLVPAANKSIAVASGRAAPLLLSAIPEVEQHHVAYKLLAAFRLLLDGRESVARLLVEDTSALAGVARWGAAREHAGVGGEAPRLLAWCVRQLAHTPLATRLVQVEGCVSSLVNMLVSSHCVMQNEALLALTLLAIEAFNNKRQADQQETTSVTHDFTSQLIKAEIGKHIFVLLETNCAKMPLELAEILIAFLDVSVKREKIAADYIEAKVPETLHKFMETREDLSDDVKTCISAVIKSISENAVLGKEQVE